MNAAGRRQFALTLVAGSMLAVVCLRSLPRPLEPAVVEPHACEHPARIGHAPMAAENLRCDGQGEPVHGTLLLLAGHRIALNSAQARELAELPGIGDKTAQRIVQHRDAHGPFPSVEALSDVRGIGAKTVEKLRPFVAAE